MGGLIFKYLYIQRSLALTGRLMGKLYVTIDDELEKEFRKRVLEIMGAQKGALSKAVNEAIAHWLCQQNNKEKKALKI